MKVINANNQTVYGDNCVINGNNCKYKGNSSVVNGDNCTYEGNIITSNGNNNRPGSIRRPTHDAPYTTRARNEIFRAVESQPIPRAQPTFACVNKKEENVSIPDEADDRELPDDADDALYCVICLTNEKQCAVLDCGHKNYCIKCSRTLMKGPKKDQKCSICNKKIEKGIMRIYE